MLRVIRQHYCSKPKIVNVLLYVYEAGNVEAAEAVKNMHVAREFVLRPVVFLRDPELGDSIRLTVDG
ncbi:hypothetical protein FJY71_08925 [candidate division WOR-3 bacterium]|nr:hypothetical protein [candidate division WOR-3 bacterium]